MNIADAGKVLAYASACDNRTVTREAALLWSEALGSDTRLDEAQRAINAHFANSTAYLMPAHINALVAEERRNRAKVLPAVIPPRELADDPERGWEWHRVWGDAVIGGHSEERARQIANRDFGIEEDLAPLAIGIGETPSLRESLDRAERERLDAKRMAEIRAEVARQAKAEEKAARRAQITAAREAATTRETPSTGEGLAREQEGV